MEKIKTVKIHISEEADEAVGKLVDDVNREFKGGRVGKAEVVSWLLLKAVADQNAELIEELQKAHFDELAYLNFVIGEMKRTQKSGEAKSEALMELLAPIQAKSVRVTRPRLKLRPKDHLS